MIIQSKTEDKPTQKRPGPWKRVALGTLVLAFAVGLTYTGLALRSTQSKNRADITGLQSQLKDANKSIDALKTDTEKLQVTTDDLGKKLAATKTEVASTAPTVKLPAYTIQMDRYHRQAANTYQDTGIDTVFMNLNIKNTSSVDGYLATSDMRLKDANNQTYSPNSSHPTPYPNNMQKLDSQAIKAGETITGAMVFNVPTGTKTFTLTYDDVQLEVNLSVVSPSYY